MGLFAAKVCPCVPPPDSAAVLLDVPPIRQSYHWDCGLACSRMVLRWVLVRLEPLLNDTGPASEPSISGSSRTLMFLMPT